MRLRRYKLSVGFRLVLKVLQYLKFALNVVIYYNILKSVTAYGSQWCRLKLVDGIVDVDSI